MRCANCGEYVDSTQLYCTNCGAKQEPVQEKAGQGGRRNKKFFLLLGVFLLLLCSVVAVHFTLSYRFDPERLVFRLEEAVKEQNPKQLINLLEKDNPNIKWTEGNAKRFLQYINEEADVHQIFAELAKQAHNPNAYHMFTPVTDRNGNNLFVLVKGEKKFGIYQRYYIEVIPFRLVVSSNLDNVDVKIDQTKKTLSNSDEKYKFLFVFIRRGTGENLYFNLYRSVFARCVQNDGYVSIRLRNDEQRFYLGFFEGRGE